MKERAYVVCFAAALFLTAGLFCCGNNPGKEDKSKEEFSSVESSLSDGSVSEAEPPKDTLSEGNLSDTDLPDKLSGDTDVHYDAVEIEVEESTTGFEIEGETLVCYKGDSAEVVIPEGVKTIGEKAFMNNKAIERVVLPEGVRAICADAFEGCMHLVEVWLPESLEVIEARAFSGCYNLKEINLQYVVELGSCAFYRCRALQHAELTVIERLGACAFGSSGLETATGLNSVKEVGTSAFDDTPFLENYDRICGSDMFICNNILILGGKCRGSIEIPPGVTTIAPYAFSGAHYLDSVVIPDSVTKIGAGAFHHCYGLDKVYMAKKDIEIGYSAFVGTGWSLKIIDPSDMSSDAVTSDFVVAGATLICYRGHDTEVVIPEDVKVIGDNAFSGDTDIVSVILPEGVYAIKAGAFESCKSLVTVQMPRSLRCIQTGAFQDCSALKEIDLQYVEEIEDQAFEGCTALSEINLAAVKTLSDFAFANSGVTGVSGMGKLSELGHDVFHGTPFMEEGSSEFITLPENCGVDYMVFGLLQEEGSAENGRFITVPPTETVFAFLKDTSRKNDKIYTTEILLNSEWISASQEYGWSLSLLELTAAEVTLKTGEQYHLIFNSGAKADWESDDAAVVSVDGDGRLTAQNAGEADVAAVIYGKEYRCHVIVEGQN